MIRYLLILSLSLAPFAGAEEPLEIAAALETRSDVEFRRLNLTAAEELMAKSVEIKKQALGGQHVAIGVGLDRLGQIYVLDGKLDAAEQAFLAAVEIQRIHPASIDLVGVLSSLGNVYLLRGRIALGKRTLEEAARASLALPGAERAQIDGLVGLASSYRASQDYARAGALMRRAMSICERKFGPDHPVTAATLTNMGLLTAEQRKDKLAASHLSRALGIFRKDNPLGVGLAVTEALLGGVYVRQGKLDEAQSLLLDSIAIERKMTGAPKRTLAVALSTLAELYVKRSELQKADEGYRESLAIFEATGAGSDPVFGGTLQRYARLLRKSHRKDQAVALETHANIVFGFGKPGRDAPPP